MLLLWISLCFLAFLCLFQKRKLSNSCKRRILGQERFGIPHTAAPFLFCTEPCTGGQFATSFHSVVSYSRPLLFQCVCVCALIKYCDKVFLIWLTNVLLYQDSFSAHFYQEAGEICLTQKFRISPKSSFRRNRTQGRAKNKKNGMGEIRPPFVNIQMRRGCDSYICGFSHEKRLGSIHSWRMYGWCVLPESRPRFKHCCKKGFILSLIWWQFCKSPLWLAEGYLEEYQRWMKNKIPLLEMPPAVACKVWTG